MGRPDLPHERHHDPQVEANAKLPDAGDHNDHTGGAGDNLDSVRMVAIGRDRVMTRIHVKSEKPPEDTTLVPPLTIAEPGKTVRETVKLDGQERQYFLHLPKDYDPAKSYPLIMVFNGWGDHKGQGGVAAGAEGMEPTTGMSDRADKDNFIVAYMDGSPRHNHSWNNGEWFFSHENDIKYTRNTMDAISQAANVDQSRIYLAGYSQGGSFAHKAAIELSDRVAAVATVGGWLSGKEKKPDNPVSVLEIHAGKDPTVPFNGRLMWLTMKPNNYLRDFYLKADGISGEPKETALATTDGTTAVEQTWKHPTNGAEVNRILLPEAKEHQYYGGFGATVNSIDTTDKFLAFFNRHQKNLSTKTATDANRSKDGQ
ncbi:MAG: alpha/beta hydrolase fold domain-containing protein [Cyanobacteria bacterium SZAS TMP-1]|nr:alpha/beta hydrolase fold domain-containing protein [Cyanobacteria bacterium SZAS TMP-1]